MQEAFYRKYRPVSLDELVGQPDAVNLIQQQVKNENLSHAYLFSGPRGVGKTSLARIIATTLGCDPVFDITEIDAASHNKVDDIRDLNDSINFIASSPGNKRVFILDEVHMLSNAASNAFLKTLEEPPAHVIFILATTEPDRVLETIKSRTTHIAFKRISNDEIVETLTKISKSEKIKISNEVLKYISNQSEGSLRDAINLFEQTHNTFGDKANIDNLYSILGKVSNADIKKACKVFLNNSAPLENEYLFKFNIYCLIDAGKNNEAQLILDLKKEQGFKDLYFEKKINYLFGYSTKIDDEISEKTVLNFHLAHKTNPKLNQYSSTLLDHLPPYTLYVLVLHNMQYTDFRNHRQP